MKELLVLGTSGMLGSMVHRYFSRNSQYRVTGTTRDQFDAEKFVEGQPQQAELKADWIINCIGVIKPFCKDSDPVGVRRAIAVNAFFPHKLGEEARRSGARVIQIATDCVYSGVEGKYGEKAPHDPLDVYGKSKSLGEVSDGSVLNIRCSIIGPELKTKVSLLEWVLGHPDGSELNGYAHHQWNGVTTLQFAELCRAIIEAPSGYERLLKLAPVHHYVPNTSVSKYELLQLMADVYGRKLKIKKVDNVGPPVDRTLSTLHGTLAELTGARGLKPMRTALAELQAYPI